MKYILETISKFLPINVESDTVSIPVAKSEIAESVKVEVKTDLKEIETILNVVEQLLDTFCLLDPEKLKKGIWQFVSYSAQLCALSILHSMSDSSQKLLPSTFWKQIGASQKMIEKQREFLSTLEKNRVEYNSNKDSKPIRFIYAAWGFIKMDGKILCTHREDKTRIDSKNYVPIGGRFEINDVDDNIGDLTEAALRNIQSSNSSIAISSLKNTVIREIKEEH